LKWRSFFELQKIQMNADNQSSNAGVAESQTLIVVSAGDVVEMAPDVSVVHPGVLISPANAGMLRVRANTVAVQIAFIIFMVSLQFRFSG